MYLIIILLTFVLVIIFVAGLIEPGNVIMWGCAEVRTRKNVLKYFGTSLLICLALSIITHNMAISAAQKEVQAKKVEEEQKKEADIKKKEAEENKKYVVLLDSGRTYETMTTEERTDATELLQTWDNKSQEFKSKYLSKKEALEKSKNDAMEKWKAEREAEAAQKAEEEKVGYDTGITYEQLSRTPDNYKGKKAKFTGKVLQVVEGKSETDLRIAVNGNYDNVIYVVYNSSIISSRVLENDNVTIKGVSQGIYTYKSTIGKSVSLPLLRVDNIDINK